MKKFFYLLLCGILPFMVSCDDDIVYSTQDVTVRLDYPENGTYSAIEGVTVTLKSTTTDAEFTATTNQTGTATFKILPGVYDASASDVRTDAGINTIYNGSKTSIIITNDWAKEGYIVRLSLSQSKTSQLVIKEVYNGGCQKNDGSGNFLRDQYIIIYNNSNTTASLKNLCIGTANPANSNMNTNADMENGVLWYQATNQIPLGCGLFTFGENGPSIEPGEQIVVVIYGAINHTTTYTNSVDLSKAEYYCCYDPSSGMNSTAYYPTPSDNIPTSHYLKGYKWAWGDFFIFSVNSVAAFIFTPQDGGSVSSFVESHDNENYYDNFVFEYYLRKMVPNKWILDGVESFYFGQTNNKKRLTPAIDAGYINFSPFGYGRTLYRNVDKVATEAIAENAGKLVYDYAGGTTDIEGGSTDPSGIDAEASIANGARIIYMDTNNSTNDFHQRKLSSLK